MNIGGSRQKSFVCFERNDRQFAQFVSLDRTEGHCYDGIIQYSRPNTLARSRVDWCRSCRTVFGAFFSGACGSLDLWGVREFVEVLLLVSPPSYPLSLGVVEFHDNDDEVRMKVTAFANIIGQFQSMTPSEPESYADREGHMHPSETPLVSRV
jgi:hypothetical protein